jgi:aspartate kinase
MNTSHPVVVKFGGTSLATRRRVRLAARRVRFHVRRGRPVIVVVSAAGGTTDRLLRGAAAAAPLRHGVPAGRAREVDRLLATGEDRSAALLAAALWSLGVPARSLRGGEAGIRADGSFGGGSIRHVASGRLRRVLEDGHVPVVSGFQGERIDGEVVTLGRGGSDTTAVAIAAALDAECHIVTDVTAVHDRDPNVHPDAAPLHDITHAELARLVEEGAPGAQVVHPAAAAVAAWAGVTLRIYHFAAPPSGRGGTRVHAIAAANVLHAAGGAA